MKWTCPPSWTLESHLPLTQNWHSVARGPAHTQRHFPLHTSGFSFFGILCREGTLSVLKTYKILISPFS